MKCPFCETLAPIRYLVLPSGKPIRCKGCGGLAYRPAAGCWLAIALLLGYTTVVLGEHILAWGGLSLGDKAWAWRVALAPVAGVPLFMPKLGFLRPWAPKAEPR